MANVQAIPEGYPRVTPYLSVDGANDAIEFYGSVLGTKEKVRMPGPNGKIAHSELALDDSLIMISDEFPEMGMLGPKAVGGSSVMISVYAEDVDDVYARAIKAGAKSLREPELQFYGDRSCQFEDPWGHRWNVATHVEDVSPEEMDRRGKEMMANLPQS